MTSKNNLIDIAARSPLWPDCAALIEKALNSALSRMQIHGSEVSIVLADDAFLQNLNRDYRGKDKPTNVLSFPQDTPGLLGDIVLAYETIAAEAAAQDKSFEEHLSHLLVHGLLHLLGHDHEKSPAEARAMEALEIEILGAMGIKNPYEIKNSVQ